MYVCMYVCFYNYDSTYYSRFNGMGPEQCSYAALMARKHSITIIKTQFTIPQQFSPMLLFKRNARNEKKGK